MYYYVDGYNLIFNAIQSEGKLQDLRQKTIHFLKKAFANHKLKGALVFDGAHRRDEESGLSYPSPLTVAYAPKGQSADDYIIERIELAKNPKQITVITNDRGLIRHARALGAKTESTHTFLTKLHRPKKSKSTQEMKDSPENIERLLKIFEKKLEE